MFLIVTHVVDSSVCGNFFTSSGAYLEFVKLRIVEYYAYVNVLPESTRREYLERINKKCLLEGR